MKECSQNGTANKRTKKAPETKLMEIVHAKEFTKDVPGQKPMVKALRKCMPCEEGHEKLPHERIHVNHPCEYV